MVKLKDGFPGSRAIVLPQSIVDEMKNDFFGSKLYITDMGYYPKAKHHYRYRQFGTPQYVLMYCIDGQGWFEVTGKQYKIEKNHFFILPPNKEHSYGADPKNPWTIYWIQFQGEMAALYGDGYDVPTAITPTNESRIADRLTIFEEIHRALEMGYSKDNINYSLSCMYYFLGSIRYIGKFRESSGKHEHSKDIVERTILYMRENIEQDFRLPQICEYLGYSKSYFSSLFKNQTGYSPMQYFVQLKIQKACSLLDFNDIKINQVCHKVGIGDPYYFSKLFTKIVGTSPTEYRRKKKG